MKWIIIAVLLFGGVIWLGLGTPGWTFPGQIAGMEGCTWAPDYCFASCVEDPNSPTQQLKGFVSWQCPPTADVHECRILSISGEANVYTSCWKDWLGLTLCDGNLGAAYVGRVFERSQWIFSPTFARDADIKIIRKVLMRCGTAACTGGGVIIVGAQGCSWSPGDEGYVWDDGTTGAKSVPFGTGYRYVCSQHLLSCPGTCTTDLSCSTPSHLKSWQMIYNGKLHNAYWSDGLTHIIGCRQSEICIRQDVGTGICLEYGTQGECGTIATLNGGECGQDSDCGIIGTYYCDFDTANGYGLCKETVPHECNYDWDCSQTGTGCYNRVLTEAKCVGNMCSYADTPVGCCIISDCPSGYFCNSEYACQKSQAEPADCPYDCCDARTNVYDADFKQKYCPSQIPYCCPDHHCAAFREDCGWVPPSPDGDANAWLWLWIPILALLFGAIGYKLGSLIGAIIGGIVGGIVGYLVYSFFSLPWIVQLLIGIGGIAGAGILIYIMLFGGGLVALAVVYSAVKE